MNSAGRAQALASKEGSIFGGVVGVFLMGLTLCITSFACTAPFLGTMIAAGVDSGGQGRLLVGMAVFGATMALPFVVLSLLPGKLPRSGAWMNSAKILFGFIELAAALKFFSNAEYVWNWLILPREIFLAVWAALFAVAGFYLLGQIRLKGESGEIGGGRLVSGSAVIVLAFYFALGATGYRLDNMVMNAFEPPYSNAIGGGGGEGAAAVESHAIVVDDFDSAVQVAKDTEKLLLINFTGLT
jgi:thiol:disulfide interchange protein DsbD